MAPTPPVDVHHSGSASTSPNHEERIRRNVACVNCRNSKVRCRQSSVAGQPCQRCAKLEMSCVVDKSHRRVAKRSKLEQLEQELQSIKQAVHPGGSLGNGWSPSSERPASSFHSDYPRPVLPHIPTPLPETPSNLQISERPPKTKPTSARKLGEQIIPGEDIDWYFDSFLQYYHPQLPILRKKDPDECFEACSTLFWVVVFVACRRFSKDEDLIFSVMDYLEKDMWLCISTPVIGIEQIHALLLICQWPLLTVRFITDPSPTFMSVARIASTALGLHTGHGSHNQFCRGTRLHCTSTDEEASSTWLSCFSLAQRTSAGAGIPPPSIAFNDMVCKKALESPAYVNLITFYNVQKFLERVHAAMHAQISISGAVPETITTQWENEFEVGKAMLVKADTDVSRFYIMSALLEVQTYYFFVQPGAQSPNTRFNAAKVFNTARSLVAHANDMEARSGYLAYAAQSTLRIVTEACCVILSVLHSTNAPDVSREDAQAISSGALAALAKCSIREGDLAYRAGILLEGFSSVRHMLPKIQGSPVAWTARPAAGFTFWALNMFKEGIEEAKKSTDAASRVSEFSIPLKRPKKAKKQQDEPAPVAAADPFQDIDWTMFMDDFNWTVGDPVFMGLPT